MKANSEKKEPEPERLYLLTLIGTLLTRHLVHVHPGIDNWQYCPIHRVQLLMRCPFCHKLLAMHRSTLGGTRMPPPAFTLAHCLFCRSDIRQFRNSTENLPNNPALDGKIRFQQAIVSAVLHGYFMVEPFEARRPLDEMLTLINGVGLEIPDERSSRVLSKMGQRDLEKLEWILDKACNNVKWLRRGHPKRSNLSRRTFELWATPDLDEPVSVEPPDRHLLPKKY